MASGLSDHDPAGSVSERVEGSPIAMGLVAFGIGFVAGSVIPPSRSEQAVAQRLEPGVTRLAQGAAETVREAGQRLAPAVQDEAASLKQTPRRPSATWRTRARSRQQHYVRRRMSTDIGRSRTATADRSPLQVAAGVARR